MSTCNIINDANAEDVNEVVKLIMEVPQLVFNVSSTVQEVLKKAKNDEFQTSKGLSILELKNQMLLNYIANLTYVIMQKLSGKKIENDAAVERLVELRTVLEKIRPIEEKLKYQIDKLVATATTGNVDTKDPLQFKANPDSLSIQDEEDAPATETMESQVYVPPKISAAYYDGDDNIEARKKRILERAQKRALSSSMLQELRKEYDVGPEEIKETVDSYKIKLNKEMLERTRYEEENMLRLPVTKKQRHEMRQMMTVTNFNPKFEDISSLELRTDDMSLKKRSRGKKEKNVKKKSGKKGFKKRH